MVPGSLEMTAQCELCRQRAKPALRSPQTPSSHTCSGCVTAGRGLCHLTEVRGPPGQGHGVLGSLIAARVTGLRQYTCTHMFTGVGHPTGDLKRVKEHICFGSLMFKIKVKSWTDEKVHGDIWMGTAKPWARAPYARPASVYPP